MNIVLGRQLGAARGLTQRQRALIHVRVGTGNAEAIKLPTHTAAILATIEQVLRRHGVELFTIPTPGEPA